MIDSEHWGHEFFEHDGRYYLCVPCGTVAVYDITVELTAEEQAGYEQHGLDAIRRLADQIRTYPSAFTERRVSGVYPEA